MSVDVEIYRICFCITVLRDTGKYIYLFINNTTVIKAAFYWLFPKAADAQCRL